MSEKDNLANQPNLFESLAAPIRFKELSDVILQKIGQYKTGPETNDIAMWPPSPEGRSYKLYRTIEESFHGRVTNYVLEHYIDELPKTQPLARYAIRTLGPDNFSYIIAIDSKGTEKKLEKYDKRKSDRQALSILTDAAPKEAAKLLDQAVNNQFDRLIGCYVLSDLATVGTVAEVTETIAKSEATDFGVHIDSIENDVLENAKKKKGKKFPHPAYEVIVQDAIEEKPTDMKGYHTIDIPTVAYHVAHEIIQPWKDIFDPTKAPGDRFPKAS